MDYTQIQLRRDTAAAWTAADPVLLDGEVGIEKDTGKAKLGDGVSTWSALPYCWGASGAGSVSWSDIVGSLGLNAALSAALQNKQDRSDRGIPGGYAPLDNSAKLPEGNIPSIVELTSQRGVAGGYPALDASSKINIAHMPTEVELKSNKNTANGYAPLDGFKRVPNVNLPTDIERTAKKGQPLGYAPLGADGKVPDVHLPAASTGGGDGSSIPRGVIVMWSGRIINIPAGWALCDGRNGTPNLLDRFICSVQGSSTDPGSTGGSTEKTLTTANLPSHNHEFTGLEHKHAIPDHVHQFNVNSTSNGDHWHNFPYMESGNLDFVAKRRDVAWYTTKFQESSSSTRRCLSFDDGAPSYLRSVYNLSTNATGGHTHSVGGQTTATGPRDTVNAFSSGNVGLTGSGQSFDVRPKYYALAYIMKL